jgi:glutaredoxin
MANTIIIFTLKGCGHCTELKKGLTELTIPFNEIIKQTGHNSLPTVFIGLEGKENGPVFVPERDFKDKDEIIEIIKKYI